MSMADAGLPPWFVAAGSSLLGICGLAILYYAGRRWSGRTRQWAVRPSRALLVVTVLPGIGVILVLVSLAVAVGEPAARFLVFAALGVMLVTVVMHMSEPAWLGPRWYREVKDSILHRPPRPLTRFEQPLFESAGTAGVADRLGADRPTSAPPSGGAVVRWPASWILELELGAGAYGVRVFDEISGFLELHRSRLVFVSDWAAEVTRGVETAVTFTPEDVRGLRQVPQGADPYGVVVKNARRSGLPGLVVETEEGPFLFGLWDHENAAKLIAEFAGLAGAQDDSVPASPSILRPWQRGPRDPEQVERLLDAVAATAGHPEHGGEDVPQPALELVPYRHPSMRFSLPLPDGWARAEDRGGIALIAAEPYEVPWLRTNIVVTIEHLTAGATLATWLEAALGQLAEGLNDFFLIDVGEAVTGGRPARRVLAHHATTSGAAVTLEQWMVVEGSLGYTVSLSVATLDYAAFAPFSARIAGSFSPDPGVTS